MKKAIIAMVVTAIVALIFEFIFLEEPALRGLSTPIAIVVMGGFIIFYNEQKKNG